MKPVPNIAMVPIKSVQKTAILSLDAVLPSDVGAALKLVLVLHVRIYGMSKKPVHF